MLSTKSIGVIERREEPSGTVVTLPRVVAPVASVVLALVFIGIMCAGLGWVMDRVLARDPELPGWVRAWGPWLLAGGAYAKVLFDAFVHLAGDRERIEVNRDFLRVVRPVWGLKLGGRQSLGDVLQIRVSSQMANRRAVIFRTALALAIRTRDGKTMYTGAGQSIEVLGELAQELGALVERWKKGDGTSEAAAKEHAVVVSGLQGYDLNPPAEIEAALAESSWEQPATSEVICQRQGDALLFRVPPAKLNSGAHHVAYLGLALMLGGLPALPIGIMGIMHRLHILWVLFLAGDVLMILLGVWTLRHGLHLIRRTGIVTARPDALTFQWKSSRRSVEWVWSGERLQEISAQPSNILSGQWQDGLCVRTDKGSQTILPGRPMEELAWMAGRLREFYGMGAEESGGVLHSTTENL